MSLQGILEDPEYKAKVDKFDLELTKITENTEVIHTKEEIKNIWMHKI